MSWGGGALNADSVITFATLSLLLPLVLIPQLKGRGLLELPWSSWNYVYSWLGWNIYFFLGAGIIPVTLLGDSFWAQFAVGALGLELSILLMLVTTIVLTIYSERNRSHGWISDTCDIAVYTLPIPMLVLGDILFVSFSDPAIIALIQTQGVEVFDLALTCLLYILVTITMIAITLCLYPRGEVPKGPRYMRIIVVSVLWLAINAHVLFGGYIPEWVLRLVPTILPVFQQNFLVYITPALFQCAVLFASMGIGFYLERMYVEGRK